MRHTRSMLAVTPRRQQLAQRRRLATMRPLPAGLDAYPGFWAGAPLPDFLLIG